MILAFLSILLVILIGVFFFIFWPVFEKTSSYKRLQKRDSFLEWQKLIQEKEVLLDNLKELQLDFQMDKLGKNDFESLKSKLMLELTELMKRVESLEQTDQFLQKVYADLEREKV